MSATTIGYDAEWRGRLTQHPSLAPCPSCGGYRLPTPHAHSPRWVERSGVHQLVDCSGRILREVTP